jgi:hypothetical protein
MQRQLAALAGGILSSYLLGQCLGADAGALSDLDATFWWRQALSICAAGLLSGTVTALISWKHTPGLPGMAFSLALVAQGVAAPYRNGGASLLSWEGQWIASTAEAFLALIGLLFTYTAAWATDTYIVFRHLPAKPPPKQVGARLMLTRLLPCCCLTGIGGTVSALLLPLPPLQTLPITFALAAGVTSRLFQARSTLWYAASAPLCLTLLGPVVLSQPVPASFLSHRFSALPGFLTVCGSASAGALLGHWIWARTSTKARQ